MFGMSAIRKITLAIVVLCIAAITVPSAAAAAEIDEPADWGDEVFNYSGDGHSPGDLEAAFINYDQQKDVIQFNITFNDSAPNNPMTDNITQIYIDEDLDSGTGLNNNTYTDGANAEKFYNNTDNLGVDYRVSIGAQTDLVAPWDQDATQFIGGEGQVIDVEKKSKSVVANVPRSAINNTDAFALKFVYVDTSGEITDEDDYTWAPDAKDTEINSTRFNVEDGTVPQATVEAVINVSDDAVDKDATVNFELEDDAENTVQRAGEITGNNNITETFTVNAENFEDGDGTLRAEINGTNYTLSSQKSLGDLTGSDVTKVFEPHERIKISGSVSGLADTEGNVTISVNRTENDELTVADETIQFSNESSKDYEFTLNATNFTDGGVVVAELDAGLNTIAPDGDAEFNTNRYNAGDKTQNFTVSEVGQKISLKTNLSKPDVFDHNGFNITVNASSDAENGEKIDSIRHRIDYNTSQLSVSNVTYLVNSPDTSTHIGKNYGHEVILANGSGLVDNGSTKSLYNITFKYEADDPDQGETVDVSPSTRNDTRLFNSTRTDDNVKPLEFSKSADTVRVTNSETEIRESDVTVDRLTAGGNMVGAPTEFDVNVTSSNDGELKNITLYNQKTDSINDTVDCEGKSECSGTLSDVPSRDTFQSGNTTYQSKQRYNITAYPGSAGDSVVKIQPTNIYKQGDVNGDGNVNGLDISHIVNNRGKIADESPWKNKEAARSDTNNDGVVDIVDITIVTEYY